MNKYNLVIASILKPINDTRMYEKFGLTLSEEDVYNIYIVGFCTKSIVRNKNIHFYPLFCFNRLSWARFIASWKFYKLLIKLKPKVVIVNTYELLIVTCIYKIIFGSKLYYDVRENYFRNIWYTTTFYPVIRNLLACIVRGIEYVTQPFVDCYFLAERNYVKEFSFTNKKNIIIENKYKHPTDVCIVKKRSIYHLLYSGTIAESYGIFDAIALVKKLHELDARFKLTIIGYAALRRDRERLLKEVESCSFIHLVGINTLVPHEDILKVIKQADIGLLPYHYNMSTYNCFPTKLFEYTFNRLPMIIPENSLWVAFCRQYRSAIAVNFSSISPSLLYSMLSSFAFYTEPTTYSPLLWSCPHSI